MELSRICKCGLSLDTVWKVDQEATCRREGARPVAVPGGVKLLSLNKAVASKTEINSQVDSRPLDAKILYG